LAGLHSFPTVGHSMKSALLNVFIAAVILSSSACPTTVNGEALPLGPFLPHHVWPVSGTAKPDFPLSSTFGHRLKASEGYRYDFHRGIDIPVPRGTAVRAIADGVVRLAGNYSSYSDTLVQIRHTKPGSEAGLTEPASYYSNYMHLSVTVVKEGQRVKRGQIVGYSGTSQSGFEHLHFEIRDSGIHQKHCIHPLLVLPYEDSGPPGLTITHVSTENPARPRVGVTITTGYREVDFNRVEVCICQKRKGRILCQRAYDTIQWNRQFTPARSPHIFLDDPAFNAVEVRPAPFNASSQVYRVDFTFLLQNPAKGDDIVVKARAGDVEGNVAEASLP
jgi:murein DD-endopeptidase MepM/ murein hydrolase activator NlpD